MITWIRERENLILISIVGAAWLMGALLYYFSLLTPTESVENAQRAVETINRISKEPGDKNMRLIHFITSELERTEKSSALRAIARHASLAFIIAGLIILAVDIHTRRETRKEAERYRQQTKQEIETYTKDIAENVWKAVSGRLVPDEICKEIDTILKYIMYKDDCHYTITIGVPYDGIDDDEVVVRRELTYTAINLTGIEGVPYPMRSHIRNPMNDKPVTMADAPVTLPAHIKCEIDEYSIPIDQHLNNEDRRLLECEVSLPKEGGKLINSIFDEILKISETNVYTTATPIKDLTVRVINNVPQRIRLKEVRLHHPREADFKEVQENLWRFKGGVLPGQGFSVSWGPMA